MKLLILSLKKSNVIFFNFFRNMDTILSKIVASEKVLTTCKTSAISNTGGAALFNSEIVDLV